MAQQKLSLVKTIEKLNQARDFLAFIQSQQDHCNNDIVDCLNSVFNPIFKKFNERFEASFTVEFYPEIKENRLKMNKSQKNRKELHYVNIDIFCVPIDFNADEEMDLTALTQPVVNDLLKKLKAIKAKLQLPLHVNFSEASFQDYI